MSATVRSSVFRIPFAAQSLRFLPEKAAYWEEGRVLMVSDLHLGKSATFRQHGLAVPEGDTAADLQQLDQALSTTEARELVIVGDLFHAASSHTPEVMELFRAWRERHASLTVTLVIGNHDRRALPPAAYGVEIAGASCHREPLHFVHDPADADAANWTICGHIHPVIGLTGLAGKGLRAPCFWLSGRTLVLPSFGGFTGGSSIRPRSDETYYAIAAGRVHEIPGALLTRK